MSLHSIHQENIV